MQFTSGIRRWRSGAAQGADHPRRIRHPNYDGELLWQKRYTFVCFAAALLLAALLTYGFERPFHGGCWGKNLLGKTEKKQKGLDRNAGMGVYSSGNEVEACPLLARREQQPRHIGAFAMQRAGMLARSFCADAQRDFMEVYRKTTWLI